MTVQIIQFARLEALVAEEPPGLVRVVVLDVTESASSQIPGLRRAGIGVHVRTINGDGHVLACYLPVAGMQVYDAVPRASDPAREAYEAAWEKAVALKERVMSYLAEKGCVATGAGVLHLGGVRPLRGTWASDPELRANGGNNGD